MKLIIKLEIGIIIFISVVVFWTFWPIFSSLASQKVIIALVGALSTVLGAYIAARAAINAAHINTSEEFRQTIIYDAWKDFQPKLFEFSQKLGDFSSTVMSLRFSLPQSGNSPFTLQRNQEWPKKRESLENANFIAQEAYIKFLSSYDSNEIIFAELTIARKEFVSVASKILQEEFVTFSHKLFPEWYLGSTTLPASEELMNEKVQEIDKYWELLTDCQIYLDDFRIELQNLTIGKLLHNELPRRNVVNTNHKVLTKTGFKTKAS